LAFILAARLAGDKERYWHSFWLPGWQGTRRDIGIHSGCQVGRGQGEILTSIQAARLIGDKKRDWHPFWLLD
jgi:hypothetical protein